MTLTLSNSNYNGEVLEQLYTVMGVGNELGQKMAATILPGIAYKKSLPKLSQTTRPFSTYTSGVPGSQTVTTTYAERSIDPADMMLYEEFVPNTFHDVWKAYQSAGDFTNLELNSQLMMAILELYDNGIGLQMSELFFQGDTGSGTAALAFFNGIVTRAIADANVVNPSALGNITASNYFDILSATWQAIPAKFIDDPDFVLMMNTSDYKLIQAADLEATQAYKGSFDSTLKSMFLTNRIKHFSGMPQNYILGAKVTASEATSNLFLGVWVPPEQENVRVDRVANNSDTWFFRVNAKADANYREASEIVLYEPA